MERNGSRGGFSAAWRSCLTCRRTWWRGCPGWSWWATGSCIWSIIPACWPYSDTQIDANTNFGVLRVRGQRLTLVAMTGEELRIGGSISAVEWVSC